MQCGLFEMKNIFFSIGGSEITQGKLEYSTDPSEVAIMSAEDRGCPVASFRDPNTLTHIFNIEVTMTTTSYYILHKLLHKQVYAKEKKEDKYLPLVFNDGHGFKIESNNALFSDIPTQNYVTESEKVTFVIKAINCWSETTNPWYNKNT